jgi:hypothetical protein
MTYYEKKQTQNEFTNKILFYSFSAIVIFTMIYLVHTVITTLFF